MKFEISSCDSLIFRDYLQSINANDIIILVSYL